MWYAYYFGIQKEGEMKIKQKYQYGEFVFRIQDFMLRENEICLEGSEESLTAEVIRKTNIKARYDAACKMLLSNSMILFITFVNLSGSFVLCTLSPKVGDFTS